MQPASELRTLQRHCNADAYAVTAGLFKAGFHTGGWAAASIATLKPRWVCCACEWRRPVHPKWLRTVIFIIKPFVLACCARAHATFHAVGAPIHGCAPLSVLVDAAI